ncbi:MAG: AraC family transcriptional regulator [Ramlibacter sp.]|nr:AraC family transcriptional regulator [Ramlibacter sp.]
MPGKPTVAATPTNLNDAFLPPGGFWIRDQSTDVGQPPLHRHEYFQIHLNISGTTQHVLGATTQQIVPGSISFVMPLRVHRVHHVDAAEFFVINYKPEFLRPEFRLNAPELEDLSLRAMPELAPFLFQEYIDFRLPPDELDAVRQLCLRMQVEHRAGGFYAEEFIRADLFRLIGVVCRRYEAQLRALADKNILQGSRRASLARASRYIREHLKEPITLADAAAAAFLSPNYLAHLLKRETGRTFGDILTAQRIDLACRLLLTSRRAVGDIAASVGFQDEAYFSRRFRQLRGVTPSAYRSDKQR